jgi:oligoribonuclease NrnB/cAMP/cGMP phosphodiesterase (DHH superfamily)
MTQASAETNLPLVLYHANCADGFGAAFTAWKKFGHGGAIYVPVSYNGFKFDVETGYLTVGDTEYPTASREVYILDFSFPRSIMEALFSGCSKVIWLDHHKTAFEMYGKSPNTIANQWYDAEGLGIFGTNADVVLDNTRSGALIAWNYFHPDAWTPKLIRHLDDYDRWVFAIPYTKEFNKSL